MKTTNMMNLKTIALSSLLTLGLVQNAIAGSTMVTDAVGTQQLWTFEEILGAQKLTSKVNQVDGKGITQTWDTNGNMLTRTDAKGRVTSYTYNTTNQKLSMTEAFGTTEARTTSYEYVNADIDLVTKTTSPSIYGSNSKEVINTYDSNLNITAVTINGFDVSGGAVSRATTFGHDTYGKVTSIDGPRTDVSDITTLAYYDCNTGAECGQLMNVTNAAGHTSTYDSYDGAARLLQSTDANGTVTTYTYHPRGWMLSMTQTPTIGSARITTYEYDNVGQMIKTILPDGTEQNYVYDAAHDLREISDNLGNKATYTYDAKGNRTDELVTDPDGTLVRSTITAYDIRNFIESINNGGSVTQLINDAVGNLGTQTDPNLNPSTNHNFDALDRLTNTVDALTNNTNYQYNVADQLVEVQAPNGATTIYEYDDLGNQSKEISPDRGTLVYTHDDAGNVLSISDDLGITITYTYDDLNRLVDVTYPDTTENINYVYDAASSCGVSVGRLCEMTDDSGQTNYTYDAWGNVIVSLKNEYDATDTLIGSFTTEYQYDDANRVTQITYPNTRIVDVTRDIIGRITAMSTTQEGVTTDLITNRTYQADGLWTSQDYTNGLSQNKTYDLQGRLTQHNADTYSRDYSYDDNGNILDIDGSLDTEFDYDVLDRLTDETSTTLASNWVFDYDANGNRLTETTGGLSTLINYNTTSNQMSSVAGSSITLDPTGRTLIDQQGRDYTYNDAGRLERLEDSGSVIAEYVYNSQQLRTQKIIGGSTTVYHYDLGGNLIAESDGANTTQEYIYADGERVATFATGAGSSEPINLALGKTTEQSTTSHGGVSSRAVDGDTSGVWSQGSITHTTKNQIEPWWQVDLGAQSDIQSVTLFNRTNCCSARLSNFYVFISDTPFAGQSLSQLIADPAITNTYHAGTLPSSSISLPLSGQGRYVRVQLTTNSNPLSLAEVQVMGSEAVIPSAINLALGKATEQSTTSHSGISIRAVDGDTSGVWSNGSITHTTKNQPEPWWQVDLGTQSNIQSVTLFNRTNCCSARLSNFYVFISDAPFASQSLSQLIADPAITNTYHAGTLPSSSISLPLSGQGRYVRVQLTSNSNPLSLAEVQVMGSEATGSTGNTELGVQFYVNDHLSTPQRLTNESNEVTWEANYEAFGEASITTELVVNNHRFPGQYYDAESGLHYNWNRYYDASVGRYVTSDPIGLRGGLNTYGYVGGNPINSADPRGLVKWTGTMRGGMALTAGIFWFNLESECVNGKKGTATVVLAGPGLGVGASLSGSGGKVELNEPLSFVDPMIFEGDGFVASAALAIPGPIGVDAGAALVTGELPSNGGGCSAVRLGIAGGYGCGLIRGLDLSIGAIYGSSTVMSSSIKDCDSCDEN